VLANCCSRPVVEAYHIEMLASCSSHLTWGNKDLSGMMQKHNHHSCALVFALLGKENHENSFMNILYVYRYFFVL
jgi:hypothetical protein